MEPFGGGQQRRTHVPPDVDRKGRPWGGTGEEQVVGCKPTKGVGTGNKRNKDRERGGARTRRKREKKAQAAGGGRWDSGQRNHPKGGIRRRNGRKNLILRGCERSWIDPRTGCRLTEKGKGGGRGRINRCMYFSKTEAKKKGKNKRSEVGLRGGGINLFVKT